MTWGNVATLTDDMAISQTRHRDSNGSDPPNWHFTLVKLEPTVYESINIRNTEEAV